MAVPRWPWTQTKMLWLFAKAQATVLAYEEEDVKLTPSPALAELETLLKEALKRVKNKRLERDV